MSRKKKEVESPLQPLSELVATYWDLKQASNDLSESVRNVEIQIKRHFTGGKTETKEGAMLIKTVSAPIGKAKDELVIKEFAQSLPPDFVETMPESLSIRWDLIANRPEMVKLAAEKGIEIKQTISYRLKLDKV
jgi:hypothetical protein